MIAHALDVQDLAAQGQDRLDVSATAVLGRTACRVALYDEELGQLGIALRAVGEFAGQARGLQQRLAAGRLTRLAGSVAGLARLLGFLDDLACLLGVLLEIVGQALGDDLAGERAHEGAAELGLGLSLELRVGELDGDDSGEALADIVTREVALFLLDDAVLAGVLVDHAGEGAAEALHVHAALDGADVVGKGDHALGVGGVPLDGHLDLAGLLYRGALLGRAGQVDGILEAIGHSLALVQELDEVDDAAGVAELLDLGLHRTLVAQDDLEVLVEERRLLQAVVQDVEVIDGGLEDLVVRPEGDGGAGRTGGADLAHLLSGLAAGELHLIDLAVATDLDVHLLGERVDDGDAHAVQAAGDLVGRVVELAAGVEDRHDDLERGDLLDRVHIDRDAAAVVHDGDRVVGMDRDLDAGAEAGHGLVDGVVDNLPHKVVQAGRARGTDIHTRADANGLEALEDLDLASAVFVLIRHVVLPF